jgi:hypothetical protein
MARASSAVAAEELSAELLVLVFEIHRREFSEVAEVLGPYVRRRVENDLESGVGGHDFDPADGTGLGTTCGAEELFDGPAAAEGSEGEMTPQGSAWGQPSAQIFAQPSPTCDARETRASGREAAGGTGTDGCYWAAGRRMTRWIGAVGGFA